METGWTIIKKSRPENNAETKIDKFMQFCCQWKEVTGDIIAGRNARTIMGYAMVNLSSF